MNLCIRWLALILLPLLVAGCTASEQSSTTIAGRVLLWHAWNDQKAAALTDVLARFQAIHPEVVVKQQVFANADEMLTQFQIAAAAGLGPDLMLAPSQWIPGLRAAELIADIGPALPGTTVERYLPAALNALRDGDGLYGVPVAVVRPHGSGQSVMWFTVGVVGRKQICITKLKCKHAKKLSTATTIPFLYR